MALSWCPTRRLAYVSVDDQEILLDYSIFENIERGLVTPSMYSWMTEWLQKTLSSRRIRDVMTDPISRRIQMESWAEDAHRAYHDLPWQTRLDLHNQMVNQLEEEKDDAEKKEKAAIDWMLEEDTPSAIQAEVCDFVRELVVKYRCLGERLENEIHEEAQWEQGGEDGASQTDGPRYDEMDEP